MLYRYVIVYRIMDKNSKIQKYKSFVPYTKEGDQMEMVNYRVIGPLDTCYKVLLIVIPQRSMPGVANL